MPRLPAPEWCRSASSRCLLTRGQWRRMRPLIGMWLIAVVLMMVGFLLLIVPGVLLLLAFWPAYYLIVDGRAGVIESFSVARRITEGNWGSAFVLYIMSIGISLLGC